MADVGGRLGPESLRSQIRFLRRGHCNDGLDAKRVLVAEDNQSAQLVLREMLERFGLVVDIVDSGPLVLKAATAVHYEAIFLDIAMPVWDGVHVARTLRAQSADLVLIAIADYPCSPLAEQDPFDDWLVAPITLVRLKSLLRKCAPQLMVEAELQGEEVVELNNKTNSDVIGHIAAHPLIDLDASIYGLLGEPLYLEAIDAFCSDMDPHIFDWKERGDGWSRERMISVSHQLKGCAGGVGATDLELLAAKINKTLRQGEDADITEMMTLLEAVVVALRP